jgi:hypothetical protein
VLAGMRKLTVETSTTEDGDHRSYTSLMHPQANLFHNVPHMPSVANVDLTRCLQSASAGEGTMAIEAAQPRTKRCRSKATEVGCVGSEGFGACEDRQGRPFLGERRWQRVSLAALKGAARRVGGLHRPHRQRGRAR